MIATLAVFAAGLTVAGTLFVALLVVRRIQLGRRDRGRLKLEERLRPAALAAVMGDDADVGALARDEAQAFAHVLARYGRQLSGDARDHIATFFEGGGHLEAERALLRHWRGSVRAGAAYTLGDMSSQTVVPALLTVLDDRERDVRAAAARSLGRLGAEAAAAPLVRALAESRVPRAVAGQALIAIGADALPALRELSEDTEAEIRAAAVELVGLVGGASDAPLVIARLSDAAAEVRARACRALGRLGGSGAADEVEALLGDRIPFVRAAAANALASVGGPAAVPALLAQARDDSFDPARAAGRALAAIDPPGLAAAAAHPEAGGHLREAADMAELRAG